MSRMKSWFRAFIARQAAIVSGVDLADVRVRADGARDRRQWPTAARLYREAAPASADSFELWVQCGNCAKEAGDLDGANDAYQRAIQISPANSDCHLQIGHLRKVEGRIADAIEYYRIAVALDGNPSASAELNDLGWQTVKEPVVEAKPPILVGISFAGNFVPPLKIVPKSDPCYGETKTQKIYAHLKQMSVYKEPVIPATFTPKVGVFYEGRLIPPLKKWLVTQRSCVGERSLVIYAEIKQTSACQTL